MSSNMPNVTGLQRYSWNLFYSVEILTKSGVTSNILIRKYSEVFVQVDTKIYF